MKPTSYNLLPENGDLLVIGQGLVSRRAFGFFNPVPVHENRKKKKKKKKKKKFLFWIVH